jgi:hypothetical protein
MAMQDALYEHNRAHAEQPEIHIRIAVNVGEVRVAKQDVFGEAVNTAARLQGVTPADAIYLTEAVYMTKNRAQEPDEAVRVHEIKRQAAPHQDYQVPRFTATKLVPDHKPVVGEVAGTQREGFTYPFGGAHLMEYSGHGDFDQAPWWRSPRVLGGVAASMLVLTAFLLWSVAKAPQQEPSRSVSPLEQAPPPLSSLPENLSNPGVVGARLRDRLGERIGQLGQRVRDIRDFRNEPQKFRVQVLMEQLWPWVLDETLYIDPNRLKDAPLPLGDPLPDPDAGALPLAWRD